MSRHTLTTTLKQYGLDERGRPVKTSDAQGIKRRRPGRPLSTAPVGVGAVALSAVLGFLLLL